MLASPGMLLLKVSVLLAAALVASRLLRVGSASRRHHMWSVTFVALLALPWLALTLPELRVPLPFLPPASAPATAAPASPVTAAAPPVDTALLNDSPTFRAAPVVAVLPAAGAASRTRPSATTLLLGIWIGGVVVSLLMLLLSIGRVHRVAARAEEMAGAGWRAASDRIAARFGIRQPVRILASDAIVTPMAGGVFRPTVYVPRDAATWTPEVRDIVLAHEMAHIASRDPLRHLVSRAAFALYWMHPLAWLAARRAAVACEQACDEAVLGAGVRPSIYANVLLDFADGAPLRLSAALPIVRRTLLETRLMAILDQPARRAPRGRPFAVAGGAIALTLCLAAAQPSATPASPVVEPSTTIASQRIAAVSDAALPRSAEAPAVDVPAPEITEPVAGIAPRTPQLLQSCWTDRDTRSFRGTISMSERGGTTIIHDRMGRSGDDWVLQRTFDELTVCALARDLDSDGDVLPSAWSQHSPIVVFETSRPGDVRHMEIADGRVTYTINGAARPLDAAATEWRTALFALLDDSWRLSQLRGRASSLQGEISSIRGNRSSLEGEISSLRGQVSSMQGEISSWRGHESSLRGEISSIRGHESSLRGAISSERGAISSLEAQRWESSASGRDRIADRIREHEQRIKSLEEEIRRYDADGRVREVERRIAATDVDAEVARIERRIRDFDIETRVAAVRRQIAELDVEGEVAGIRREIDALDVESNSRTLEARIATSLRRLRAVGR
jgi:beta-lactamase regulating signal transducer with metallopeptidase domain/predicted  nucleic acid-binding Zn-ribbon protein